MGYVGSGMSKAHIIEGLARLEYRGYDTGGFGCLNALDTTLAAFKVQGSMSQLIEKVEQSSIDGPIGIGHLRWSVHELPELTQAHPQVDCTNRISLVYNGIIENCLVLRDFLLETGHVFHNQAHSEILAHLVEALLLKHTSLRATFVDLTGRLVGAYALACILQEFPDTLIVARKHCPLYIGIGEGEMFIASDPLSFAGKVQQVVFMPDETFALVHKESVELYSFGGQPLPLPIEEYTVAKGSYEHFMLKEMYDQKKTIYDTVHFIRFLGDSLWDRIGIDRSFVSEIESLHLFGCGTSWNAASIGAFFFEEIARLPAKAYLASEFRDAPFFPQKKSLYIGVSQSGETMDTLESLRLANALELSTLALTNVASSSMVREATGFLLTRAGLEVAVASTKAFTAQLSALYLLAYAIAFEKKLITQREVEAARESLMVTAEVQESALESYKWHIISTIAPLYAHYKHFIFLGRHIAYPFALEAALKLKQMGYLFVDVCPAGEFKHGSVALVDQDVPTFLFSSLHKSIYQKLIANAQEVKARHGHLVVFAFAGQEELIELADRVFVIPSVEPLLAPLAMTALMQFLMYQIGLVLEHPIDKPRNLAKAVMLDSIT